MVSLVEPALVLGVFSLGVGAAAGFLGVGHIGVALATAAVPTAVIGVFAGLGGIMHLMWRNDQRHLKSIDPNWESKVRSVNRRLKAAVYRWQLQEFGYATKAFSVQQRMNDDRAVFDRFRAKNDIDPFDFEESIEEFEEAANLRQKEVAALVPSAEAEARLNAKLNEVLENTLEPELRREVLRQAEININTTVLF